MSAETGLNIRESVSLAPFTTIGLGGSARWFSTASDVAHITAAHSWCREHDVPLLVLGGGSNLVIADEGFNGLVLHLALTGVTLEQGSEGTRATVGASELWDDFVAATVARNLAGVECLSGIPGTVGGTPIQNVGAYGQEVAETIEAVTAFDIDRAATVEIPASECGFSYRMSRFKSEPGRFIVTHVAYRLKRGDPSVRYPDLQAWLERAQITNPTLEDVRRAVIAVRRTKGMVVDPDDPDSRSVGSFFMNPIVPVSMQESIAHAAGEAPPAFALSAGASAKVNGGENLVKIPAAWLIERSGFRKGHIDGAVGISTKHPLALINRGSATARDLLRLATEIKRRVADRFGVALRPEPIFVGFTEDSDATYLLTT
jgi:UDP-N-acetylmuramate dehydrogenase